MLSILRDSVGKIDCTQVDQGDPAQEVVRKTKILFNSGSSMADWQKRVNQFIRKGNQTNRGPATRLLACVRKVIPQRCCLLFLWYREGVIQLRQQSLQCLISKECLYW